MKCATLISPHDLEKLRSIDTCTISNAIERLDVRLRNEGFASDVVRCQFPQFGPMVGYAVTGKIRSSMPPISSCCYHYNADWWEYVDSMPKPCIMVVEDTDDYPGFGALVGEVHAAIGLALDCVGYLSNGAVRDIPQVERQRFHLFAGSVSVSHAYAHIAEFGCPVEIGGLKINPGDLIHGDRHGVLTIPLSIAGEIPEMACKILEEERELIEFCRSRGFTLESLSKKLKRTGDGLISGRRER